MKIYIFLNTDVVVLSFYLSSLFFLCSFSDHLPVCNKFDMRSDPGRTHGKLLLEIVSIVPDGHDCFFVSYPHKISLISIWKETGVL